MVKVNKKSIIISLLLILLTVGLVVKYLVTRNSKNIEVTKNEIIEVTENKIEVEKIFNYENQIPSELKVVGVISKDKILVYDDDKIKEFFVDENKYGNTQVKLKRKCKLSGVSVSENGIAWVETNNDDVVSTIYYKNFNDNDSKVIDKTTADLVPYIILSDNYLVYNLETEDNMSVNIVDIKDNYSNEKIYTSELPDDKYVSYISFSDIYEDNIIWSDTVTNIENRQAKSSIYKYNIKSKKTEKLESNDNIHDPIIYKNKVFGIKPGMAKDCWKDEGGNNKEHEFPKEVIAEYLDGEWKEFLPEEMNKIVKKQSTIQAIIKRSNIMYWYEALGSQGHFYDIENNKMNSLYKDGVEENKYNIRIMAVNNDILVYTATDEEGYEYQFIYYLK